MKTYTSEDFKRWGAQGPKRRKRNRTLTPEQAKAMVRARKRKAAARWGKHKSL